MPSNSPILWHNVIDSTNKEVRRLVNTLDNLSVIAAECQTDGRGQGDHKWTSNPGDNLTFTVLMRFGEDTEADRLDTSEILQITYITTLAVRDFLLDNDIEARIKWPNDIWVGDLKICGILIENILEGQEVSCSIVGIGLNLNQLSWPDYIPNPVSMKILTGRTYPLKSTLEALYEKIRLRYTQSGSVKGRKALEAEFNSHMFHLDAVQ